VGDISDRFGVGDISDRFGVGNISDRIGVGDISDRIGVGDMSHIGLMWDISEGLVWGTPPIGLVRGHVS